MKTKIGFRIRKFVGDYFLVLDLTLDKVPLFIVKLIRDLILGTEQSGLEFGKKKFAECDLDEYFYPTFVRFFRSYVGCIDKKERTSAGSG